MLRMLMFLVTFAILASPAYFKFLRSVVGGWAASPEGLAKPAGLFVAGLVLMVVLSFERRISGYGIGLMTQAQPGEMTNFDPCAIAKNLQDRINICNKSSSGTSGYTDFSKLFRPSPGTTAASKNGQASGPLFCSNVGKLKAQQKKAQDICDAGN